MRRGPRGRALRAVGVAAALLPAGCVSTFERRAPASDHPSVASLYAEGARRRQVGSGFLVAPDRMVTAHHVARAAAIDVSRPTDVPPRLVAVFPDGTNRRVVAVRGSDPLHDLIALDLEAPVDVPVHPIATAAPEVGARVVLVGYGKEQRRIGRGRVVSTWFTGDPEAPGFFVATCPVVGGDSGGPAFDADGAIVGVGSRSDDGRLMAQTAANAIPLLDRPAVAWGVWGRAELASPDERAARTIDLATIWDDGTPVKCRQSLAAFRQARSLGPDERAVEAATEGECICLSEMGRAWEVVQVLAARLRETPDCAWGERLLGRYLLQLREPEGYAHLQRASALDPAYALPALDVAEWAPCLPTAPDPLPDRRRAVRPAPGWGRAWSLLGAAADREGLVDEAARAWEAAARIRPDHADTLTSLARAWCRLRRYREAREAAEAALRIDPKSEAARAMVAFVVPIERLSNFFER